VSWLVNPEWAPLLEGNPYLSDVIEFPRKKLGGLTGWTRFPGWVRALKERVMPDVVLDFQGLLRSALIARGVGGQTWGMSDSREGARYFHHKIVPVPGRAAEVHAVTRLLKMVEALGCPIPEKLEWPLPCGTAPKTSVPSRYVLLHPFSRGRGKSLTAQEVEEFCQVLAPIPVVLAGRSEVELRPQPNLTNLLNQTSLPELCWLVRNADFTVSVDSGPMHIAAALTDRLLAIHTWSDPWKVGPFQPRAWVWKDSRIGNMESFPEGEPCARERLAEWVTGRLSALRA
jgi:heptosyltransferase I